MYNVEAIALRKTNMSSKFATLMSFCLITMISCIAFSCTGSGKNGISPAASQSNPPNTSSPFSDSPLIPYGEYIASASGYSESIVLNADGTYTTEDFFTGKTGGTYTVSPDYITLYCPSTNVTVKQKYSYSEKLKCLYLYTADSGSPMSYYKR
jgi:hypothetical protein